MIYNLDLFGIGDAIVQGCRTLVGWFAAMIYNLIIYIYHVFELLGRAEIINNEFVQIIYSRVGMILGIFMVFKLTFSLIQALIEPEKLNDQKNGYGQIIKRCVISIVLLGITPSLFREAFKIQNLIVGGSAKDNVIYKLISGNSTHNNNTIGRELAGNLYFDFVTDDEEPKLEEGMLDDYGVSSDGSLEPGTYIDRFQEENWENIKANIINEKGSQSFSDIIDYLAIKDRGKYVIELNWFPLLVVGLIILYMISVYCIQIGVRVVQLAYLQLIAPIPILSYISDPEGSFKKWIKQCTTTYLDLFIRLAIIYFVMTLIADVLEQLKPTNVNSIIYTSAGLADEKWYTIVLVKAFIIIGLLLFAKKVPELLKDLFPNLGGGAASLSFGLGLKKNVLDPLKDVGKSLYNSPIGWGLKGGKKLGTYIDRKAHHLPKPRGKIGQTMDKWLPGRGEVIKQRRQAQEDERQFNRNMEQGEKMHSRFGDDLIVKDDQGNIVGTKSGAFSSKDYASSYLNLERAKAENKKAEQEYQTEYAKYQAAYSRGDQRAIKEAEERIKIAEKNKKIASGKLELAQNKHNANKKIYTSDAQREETYDYYKKTHGTQQSYSSEVNQSRSREEIVNNIAQLRKANGKEERTGFTDAERQAEAERRESQRSSYNNEHESELASQSIFSDNDAMRQSDIEYNTGVSRSSPSDNDAPLSSSQYDRGLQSALTKLDDLYNQGASDEEIQQQLDGIKELTERKEKALKREKDHLDDFHDRQDDGFGGQ